MEQKKLWDELAHGELGKLYLLYGEERFLVARYAAAIEKTAGDSQEHPLYKDVFESASTAQDIISAAETVPFLPGKRLIVVKDSKLFAAGRKAESETMAEYLPKIPNETIIVFIESEIDRRLRLFKRASELGRVLDCEIQTPQALVKWLTRMASEKGKNIAPSTANLLLSTCGNDMTNLFQETDKLINYCGGSKEITPADIKAICTPTLEARIFGLTKAMGAGRASEAISLYNTMLIMKESPISILSMIIRQLRIILLCKCANEKNIPRPKIAGELNIRDFVVSEALAQGKRFTKEHLILSLKDCQDTDIKIKTGLISQEIGVEMLLLRVSGTNNIYS